MRTFLFAVLVTGAAFWGAGCAKTEVTESDINALSKEHSQGSYEEAMKKAGRSAELEEQKKLAAERGQGDPGR